MELASDGHAVIFWSELMINMHFENNNKHKSFKKKNEFHDVRINAFAVQYCEKWGSKWTRMKNANVKNILGMSSLAIPVRVYKTGYFYGCFNIHVKAIVLSVKGLNKVSMKWK